jgi:hypothetical protein
MEKGPMTTSLKPKRALIAYCVLAERLHTPGVGMTRALTPFLAEACQQFAGELFDAGKLSTAVAEHYGIRIPRLAALGLAEQLARDGLLTTVSGYSNSVVYQYAKSPAMVEAIPSSPVTEAEVEAVLSSFVEYCRTDKRLDAKSEQSLQGAFLDRLLHTDAMRILGRREASIAAKKSPDTLLLKKAVPAEPPDSVELHLDFLVSQFLLDLRDKNAAAFDRVSNVAFANMAAEAIACFREPSTAGSSLNSLTVYLDSPLLLDMLGVNAEYAEYGTELLEAIHASGAQAAVLDHCVAEAEAAIHAQLAYLRSGVNQLSAGWGTTAKPDLLAALSQNVGERAEKRLGIALHRDPEINLHRRSQEAVGDIEAGMIERMRAWRNEDAKEHDRKSVWAMLAMRDATKVCDRLCDSQSLLLTRNTALVSIANGAWVTWLKGSTKHSSTQIERWTPVAMSDKQFAGYLWMRSGGGSGSITRARLLAHCSAAVRPRADVKARAYNLVLELSGREEADDISALLEDREGARALMRATTGDPEDVTRERLPFILEKVKLAAGEYAAAAVREESARQLEQVQQAHKEDLERLQREAAANAAHLGGQTRDVQAALLQQQQEQMRIEAEKAALASALDAQIAGERRRQMQILRDGLGAGTSWYRFFRWTAAVLFGVATALIAELAIDRPTIAAGLGGILGFLGFSFVPDVLNRPLNWIAMKRLRAVVKAKDPGVEIPTCMPDFKNGTWIGVA